MSDDVLAGLPVDQVASFYNRLADGVDKNKGSVKVSLAAILLRQWLKNRNPSADFALDPPEHLKTQSDVKAVLKYHRDVFLTEQKARVGKNEKWAGLIPRLQGKGYPKWDGKGELSMEYQSLVEIPLRYQITGSDADKDILYALHGFQLNSKVGVIITNSPTANPVNVTFARFETQILDRYDWDYSEHLTVPNPDFGSKAPNAVTPTSKTVLVYHKNAERVEKANLAAPYNIKSKFWTITDLAIMGPAKVNPNKSI
jgi:hypothetical protein